MPAATDTFRLSTAPASGMPTMRSQSSRVSRRRPPPSAPSTHATGPPTSASNRFSPPASAPRIQTPLLLEVAQRACEIGHRDHGHRIGGATRRLRDRRVDADGAVLRHDHGVRAEGVRAAQARAQVVRIRDAVENEEQQRLARRPDHFIERDLRRRRVDDGNDALVAIGPRKVAQARFVGRVHRTPRGRRTREKLAHARAVLGVGHVERKNGFRPLPQSRGDRVEAVQGSRGRHFPRGPNEGGSV